MNKERKFRDSSWFTLLVIFPVAFLIVAIFVGVSLLQSGYNPFEKRVPNNTETTPGYAMAYETSTGNYDYEAAQRALYVEVNKVRTDYGLEPLERAAGLENSAEAKCADMRKYNYYDHVNPKTKENGTDIAMDYFNHRYGIYSENLTGATEKESAKDIYAYWMESPAHKEAILNFKYDLTGIAICREPGSYTGMYVVQHFFAFQ